ncbi:2-amino-4-hydroxy-6-hydroxymethyldihydropteridine diphosphokinase [Candidatus Omnitrophota bacterium]
MISVASYLGVGSNLGDRIDNIRESVRLLESMSRVSVKAVSALYEAPACGGPKNQPKYINAAIKIQTTLTPFDLLGKLKSVESRLKRKKTVRWGSRTIDLDILFYGDLTLVSPKLIIPHPLLHKRIFVLKPLSDIASKLTHPLFKRNVKGLLARTKSCA